MRITSWTYLVLLCLLSKTISAQVYIDLINAGINQNLKTKYEGFNNKYQQQTAWLHTNIPFVLNDAGDFLMPSVQYSTTTLQHDFFEEGKLRFHNIQFGVSWLKNWKNPYWSSYFDARTGINSDLEDINSEHYTYETTLLLYHGKRNELVWNFGANYTGGAFGSYIVPLLGVDWMINNKTTLSYQVFSHFQLDYQLTPKVYAGLMVYATPFIFNITDYYGESDSYIHTYTDRFPYTPQSLSVYTDYYVNNEIVLFGKAGYEFSKTLYHENAQGEALTESPYQGDIEPGLFVEIGIAWRKRTARKFKYQ